jgi:hypothetical protein
LAITIILAVLVGVVVYAYEERWGRFAYFVGEAIAAILVIGLTPISAGAKAVAPKRGVVATIVAFWYGGSRRSREHQHRIELLKAPDD